MQIVRATTKNAFGSWRTSLVGLMTCLTISWPQIQAAIDANVETVPDWNIVAAAVQIFVLGLIARDNQVSSERVDAK